ncbi:MAG: zinc protease [Myxococcota bacterium]|jgi:zinc protease
MIALILACGPKNIEPDMNADPLSLRPTVADPAAYAPPVPQEITLSNGVGLWLEERSDLPLVSIRLVIDGGAATDPPEHPGLAWLTDSLLTHGAGDRDAVAFAEFVEQQAIDLSVSTFGTTSVVRLSTHTDRLDDALDLLADAVLRPALAEADLARVRELQIGDITQSLDEPWTVAPWVASRLYFGESHPLAHPNIGTPEGLAKISDDDLRASWSSRYVASRAHFVVVGAVSAETITAGLESRLAGWSAGEPAADLPPPAGVTDGPRLVFVDNPGAAQTALRVVMPGWSAGAEDLAAGELATIAIGGTFTSRLNRLMREEKGYTYGARARVISTEDYGLVVASSSVQVDSSAEGLTDMLSVLRTAAEGFIDEEQGKAYGSLRTDLIESMGSRSATASSLAGLHTIGLPPTDLGDSITAAAAVDTAAMQAAWTGRADLTGALILVVGDLTALKSSVEAAIPGDWTVVEPAFPTPEL